MNIESELFVKDRNNVEPFAIKIASDIDQIAKYRMSNSETAKSLNVNLYIYVAVNLIAEEEMAPAFEKVKPHLYFAKDDSLATVPNMDILGDVLKRGIVFNINIPVGVESCQVYISIKQKSLNDLYANRKPEGMDETRLTFTAEEPMFTLDEVVMNDDERNAIMRAVTLIKEKELVFDKWNFKKIDKHTKSILCFHGAPGTGKTMAAHGVAHYLGKKILIGSYAQIESQFVGVGAKNLQTIFRCAAEQDAVLFIDEADTFLSRRIPGSDGSGTAKHYNSMSNDLFQLVESFDGCIIFASNHITDFDPAIISRIIEPVEFKMPDESARRKILENMIQDEMPVEGGKTEELISELAIETEGFSGRDIRKALLIANANAAYKYKVEEGLTDEKIVIPVQLLKDTFVEVRKAKDALHAAIEGRESSNLLLDYTEKRQSETRYLQMAAHALLADDVVDTREKALFDELSNMLQISVPLNKDKLPSVEEICKAAKTKEERIRLLDVSIRMSACDQVIHKSEEELILKVADLIGIGSTNRFSLEQYLQNILEANKKWEHLKDLLGMSDNDILEDLKKEYTSGAAYYHLAEMYKEGSELYGGIPVNAGKAEQYFTMAKELGFKR